MTIPPQPNWQQPAPKKKHTLRNALLILGIAAVGSLVGCIALIGGAANQIDKENDKEHTVTYTVTGTSKTASLTYTTDGGTTTEQSTRTKLPWSKTITVKGLFHTVQVSAQNDTGRPGTVVCVITYDDKKVKTATGSGVAAIASCDYTPSQ